MATNIPGDINQTKQRNAAPVAKKQTSFDATNTPGLKLAGPPAIGNIASPGYSSFSPVRDIQKANDRRSQSNAVAADGVVQKVDQLTQGAIDQTMQQGAVATASPVIPTPLRTGDNPQRAAMMQASYDQPVTRGEGVPIQPVAAGMPAGPSAAQEFATGFGTRLKDISTGSLQTGIGALATIPATMVDYGRQGLAAVSGGQLTEQQKNSARTMAGDFMGEGVDRLAGAFDGTAEATRNLIGATKAQPQAANPAAVNPAVKKATQQAGATEDKTAVAAPGSKPAANPALPDDQYTKTGIGTNAGGGEIVGRTGENGVKEFSNRPTDQLAALDPSQSSFRVQGQQGDARSALEIGDAKNAQLRQAVALQRGHEVGNGPGNVGQVSSTTIEQAARKAKITGSATDRAAYDSLVKLDAGQAADRIEQNGKQQPGWKTDAEKAAAQATTAKAETDQQLNAATSQQQAARARNLSALEAAVVDPNSTPDERAQARQAYDVLTTTADKRYTTVKGGETPEGNEVASQVFDNAAGAFVGAGGAQAPNAPPGMTLTGQTRDGKKVYTDANGNKHVES